ncbi:MAG: hypothetical protein M3501_09870, partial [Actinomycetota bacterium]|nr:hypothetical protein [Actinomycetota bacterium]
RPGAAGAAVLVLQQTPTLSPTGVRDSLVGSATTGVVTSAGSGSPNRLLYTLGGASPPPPPPPPSGCASLPEQFSGSLSGAGDFDNHPNGTYFYTPRSGTHRGCLDGPSGVDFDLFLRKWNGFTWVTVAQGGGDQGRPDLLPDVRSWRGRAAPSRRRRAGAVARRVDG